MSSESITGAMILPEDVLVIPVPELSEQDRERISADDDQFAVTRRYARVPSKVLSKHAAGILERFRNATPIAEAVADYAKEHALDPREMLREAYPLLRGCIAARLLVPADSPTSARIVPILVPGDRVASMEVVRCVQVMDDTEVYQVRHHDGETLALKMLRPECAEGFEPALDREAAILSHLGGEGVPPLHGRGTFEGRAYLALGWCPGVSPRVIADEIRTQAAPDRDAGLLQLGRSILEAYVSLHSRGVVHGDPHPGNLLVDGAGISRILDFGYARMDGEGGDQDRVPRAGVALYLDPQYATARLERRAVPPITREAEQYSIAAILYFLLAGQHTRDFPVEADEMLRQICEEPPLPFARRGVAPWPDAERVLARGLAKQPNDRFGSMAEFLEAWSGIPPRSPAGVSVPSVDPPRLGQFVEGVLARLQVGGPLWSDGLDGAPTCSLSLGGAGIAYALYRLACVRDSSSLLFEADAWLARAEAEAGRPDAFYEQGTSLTIDRLGLVSPYHTESGVHAVRALVSQAMGDGHSAEQALGRFIASSGVECDELDLWLGRAGTLLACANLLRAIEATGTQHTDLRALGEQLGEEVGETLRTFGAIRDCAEIPNYGMAHGWAGLLFAAVRWCVTVGREPYAWIGPRLEELAEGAEPYGRGVRWPWRETLPEKGGRRQYAPGWCAGSAGFVHLWTLASEVFGRDDYLELAEQAAWYAWEGPATTVHLCCGYAGRAYSLLDLYSRTGDAAWRSRAESLAGLAVARKQTLQEGNDVKWAERSLYRGELGVALLVSELATPEVACMPFFGDEGWPAPVAV